MNEVEPRLGSAPMAYAWYRSEPLPGQGERTAIAMVQVGRADDVPPLIGAVDAGFHA